MWPVSSSGADLRDLHHHRTGQDDVVGEDTRERRGAGKVDIGEAGEVLGDLAGAVGKGSEGSATGDTTRGESAAGGLGGRVGRKLDGSTRLEVRGILTSGHGESGEGGQDQVRSLGAAGDEGSRQREDLLG